ncbi:hypothetical protein [Paenibacillus radicis (ex Xue et al. 2023)]|uniref:Uncharacterized protein n=1 Tax=Paenibacillus radicis (ex Xue et al. 2023) TaxID=2972489 RepID=A0ABT1YPA5_9BACL|nr:hypothetical protein [Paenibacillus radicis (ex Xue et al. 2023)]MCR8634872.1 hypothetical protein [Paenibacillus radicis (ex Xue et al. 2023)]
MDEKENHEPTIAPGMSDHQELEEKATEEEVSEGESTSVTQLYLDRTPEK